MIPKLDEALKDYLTANKTGIIGGSDPGNKLTIILDDFNEDTGIPAIMIRESGGEGHTDIPSMAIFMVQVWVRAGKTQQAKLLMRKVDSYLHRYGPALMTTDVYVWTIKRNTNPQRLDDPDSGYAQYFCIYNVVCRETIGGA